MALVERWNSIESGLDPSWKEATLTLAIYDGGARSRAAALLGPAGPGIAGTVIRFEVSTRGTAVGPEAVRRLLGRIDQEGIVGRLELVASRSAPPEPEPEPSTRSLAEAWRDARASLPADWSDVLLELELESSGDLDRAAVLCAPLNPIQEGLGASSAKATTAGQPIGTLSTPRGGRPGFRFRCASEHGYGASAGMVGRCLARLDEAGIGGHVRLLRVLSDVQPVGTQGATFVVGRRPA